MHVEHRKEALSVLCVARLFQVAVRRLAIDSCSTPRSNLDRAAPQLQFVLRVPTFILNFVSLRHSYLSPMSRSTNSIDLGNSSEQGTHGDGVTSRHVADNVSPPPALQLSETPFERGAPARASSSRQAVDGSQLRTSPSPLARSARDVAGGSRIATPVAKDRARYVSLATTAAAAAIAYGSRNISVGRNGGRRLDAGAAAISTGSSSGLPASLTASDHPLPVPPSLRPLLGAQLGGSARVPAKLPMPPLRYAAGSARTICTPAAAVSLAAVANRLSDRGGQRSNSGKAPKSPKSPVLLVSEEGARRAQTRRVHFGPSSITEAHNERLLTSANEQQLDPHQQHGGAKRTDVLADSDGGLAMFGEQGPTTLEGNNDEDVYPLYRKPDEGATKAAEVIAKTDTERREGDHPRPYCLRVREREVGVVDSSSSLWCDSTVRDLPEKEGSSTDHAEAKPVKTGPG